MSLEGEQLGHYRLLRQIGRGGMGEVYLAEDPRIGRKDAIKIIRNEDITHPGSERAKEAARLFEREVKAIARLDHPNILPLYAYGEERVRDIPLIYLVMPYRKEGTLADWLRQRGGTAPLTPAEVVPLMQQAAAALQHAHEQQVIHQDIKPTNFLIRLRKDRPAYPDLLLADFGIAKLSSTFSTASQNVRGTPIYMAPEQWDGQPVPATDQYALAIMLYQLLVGRPPFQGGPGQVMRQHYQTPPPLPSTLNPRLSLALDAVLLRALSKQPTERFLSMTAFAQAFQEAMQETGKAAPTVADSLSQLSDEKRQMSMTLPDPLVTLEPPMPTSPLSESILTASALTASTPTSETSIHRPPLLPSTSPSSPSRLNTRAAVKPVKTALARRIVLVGLAGLVIVALIRGVVWFTAYQTPPTRGTQAPLAGRITSGANATTTVQAPSGIPEKRWQTQNAENASADQSLTGVAWSGSQFVAVGRTGINALILTSPDGHTWTAQNAQNFDTSAPFNGIAWLDKQFVVVGDGSAILTSPDGHTWTAHDTGKGPLDGVAWSGTQFVVVGYDGAILTSPDGHIWTAQNSATTFYLKGITWSGTQFVVVGDAGTILTSPDGRIWTAQNSGTSDGLEGIAWSGTQFVVVGDDGTLLTSPDGHIWTAQNSSTLDLFAPHVAWLDMQFVIVDDGTILTSSDGRTWTAQNSGTPNALNGVAWSGTRFVVVGDDGTILTSP